MTGLLKKKKYFTKKKKRSLRETWLNFLTIIIIISYFLSTYLSVKKVLHLFSNDKNEIFWFQLGETASLTGSSIREEGEFEAEKVSGQVVQLYKKTSRISQN